MCRLLSKKISHSSTASSLQREVNLFDKSTLERERHSEEQVLSWDKIQHSISQPIPSETMLKVRSHFLLSQKMRRIQLSNEWRWSTNPIAMCQHVSTRPISFSEQELAYAEFLGFRSPLTISNEDIPARSTDSGETQPFILSHEDSVQKMPKPCF